MLLGLLQVPLLLLLPMAHALVPSQVLLRVHRDSAASSNGSGSASVRGTRDADRPTADIHPHPSPPLQRKSEAPVAELTRGDPSPRASTAATHARNNTFTPKFHIRGSLANVCWRAVSEDDLRAHPLYEALPHPSNVSRSLDGSVSAEHFRLFPQDSVEWQVLHAGRVTTSIAGASAGLFEPASALALGIPASLSGSGRARAGFARVREEPLRSLPALLLDTPSTHPEPVRDRRTVWMAPHKKGARFPFVYAPAAAWDERRYAHSSVQGARLAWGSAQEATGTLVAVNYFAKQNATISEVGLCALEAVADLPSIVQQWMRAEELPLVGASPDGLIRFADHTEVLEVKCTSPFMSYRASKGPSMQIRSVYYLDGVPVWHVPQLQLEILCAGPDCRAAVVVCLTATEGATLYRVDRDDAYIISLLGWIRRFNLDFCKAGVSPPENFFHDMDEYASFLRATAEIAKSASTVVKLSQSSVQRSPLNLKFFL